MPKTAKTYRVTIGRRTIEICASCYQRLRRAGKVRLRPYRKHSQTEPKKLCEQPPGPQRTPGHGKQYCQFDISELADACLP
jgi:hypothetical protein